MYNKNKRRIDKINTLEILQEQWNYVSSLGYNEDRFLGIFSETEDSEDSVILLLPSFDELCLRTNIIYKTVSFNNSIIYIKDIRVLILENINLKNKKIINKKYEKLFDIYFSEKKSVEDGIVEILKYSFTDEQLKNPSKKDFLKQLTNAETKAYYSIVKEIGDEGNITISKLVEKNSISRPVYNNLINKMKENNVASIVNMGMKGTYIKITEIQLKAEAMDYKD